MVAAALSGSTSQFPGRRPSKVQQTGGLLACSLSGGTLSSDPFKTGSAATAAAPGGPIARLLGRSEIKKAQQ